MAETADFQRKRGAVVRISDGSGTPKTFDFPIDADSFTFNNGGYEDVRMTDMDGDLEEIVKHGKQAGESTIGFTIKIRDGGVNPTEAVIIDVLNNTGYFASDWVTTGATGSDEKKFKAEVIMPSTGGAVATYTLLACHVRSVQEYTVGFDGMPVAVVLASHQPKVTITRA